MERYFRLKENIARYKKIAIALSGGNDSVLLLRAACDELGAENVLAITADGALQIKDEISHAKEMANRLGVRHKIANIDFLAIPQVKSNSPLRCYYCKRAIFEAIISVAAGEGIDTVCDGTNASDKFDDRPGMRALQELDVCSPLRDVGITKEDVAQLMELFNLPTRPSNSCLATRIPFGRKLDCDILNKVYAAEKLIRDAGFLHCRVRLYGNDAHIELPKSDFAEFIKLNKLHLAIKAFGFTRVSLDLMGMEVSK